MSENWVDDLTPLAEDANDTEVAIPQGARRSVSAHAEYQHMDDEVASEIQDKLLNPRLTEMQDQFNAFRAESQDLTRRRVDSDLRAKYPQAPDIISSREFSDFLNGAHDSYAKESGIDRIYRAYLAGDSAYILDKLDRFAESRKKPSAPVGAEGNVSVDGAPNVGAPDVVKKPQMTAEQYHRRRRELLAQTKGTRNLGARKALAEEFLSNVIQEQKAWQG